MKITREEMIKKYATDENEKKYIENLGEGVLEQVSETIDSMEKDWETKEISFQTILDQSLTTCIMTYDFITQNMTEERFPNARYTVLHMNVSNSDWHIEQDDDGDFVAAISMSDEHYMIMSLLGTLSELNEYIFEQNVAMGTIFVNNINGSEY